MRDKADIHGAFGITKKARKLAVFYCRQGGAAARDLPHEIVPGIRCARFFLIFMDKIFARVFTGIAFG